MTPPSATVKASLQGQVASNKSAIGLTSFSQRKTEPSINLILMSSNLSLVTVVVRFQQRKGDVRK